MRATPGYTSVLRKQAAAHGRSAEVGQGEILARALILSSHCRQTFKNGRSISALRCSTPYVP